MLRKRGQDLPIFCQANMRPFGAENPDASPLCPWGPGSVVEVVREGRTGAEGAEEHSGSTWA